MQQEKERTRSAILHYPQLALIVDAGNRRGAKSEPVSVIVRNEAGEVFAGLVDICSEPSENDLQGAFVWNGFCHERRF